MKLLDIFCLLGLDYNTGFLHKLFSLSHYIAPVIAFTSNMTFNVSYLTLSTVTVRNNDLILTGGLGGQVDRVTIYNCLVVMIF